MCKCYAVIVNCDLEYRVSALSSKEARMFVEASVELPSNYVENSFKIKKIIDKKTGKKLA